MLIWHQVAKANVTKVLSVARLIAPAAPLAGPPEMWWKQRKSPMCAGLTTSRITWRVLEVRAIPNAQNHRFVWVVRGVWVVRKRACSTSRSDDTPTVLTFLHNKCAPSIITNIQRPVIYETILWSEQKSHRNETCCTIFATFKVWNCASSLLIVPEHICSNIWPLQKFHQTNKPRKLAKHIFYFIRSARNKLVDSLSKCNNWRIIYY